MMFYKAMGLAPPFAIEGLLPIIPAAQFLSKKLYGWGHAGFMWPLTREELLKRRLTSACVVFLSATHGQKQVTPIGTGLHAVVERFEEIDKDQRGMIGTWSTSGSIFAWRA